MACCSPCLFGSALALQHRLSLWRNGGLGTHQDLGRLRPRWENRRISPLLHQLIGVEDLAKTPGRRRGLGEPRSTGVETHVLQNDHKLLEMLAQPSYGSKVVSVPPFWKKRLAELKGSCTIYGGSCFPRK